MVAYVIASGVLIVLAVQFVKWLARRSPAPAAVKSSGSGLFPVLVVAGIAGLAVAVSKGHHTPAPAVPPVGAPAAPPKVTIVHQAPFHFPLTGTQIVWVVVILAVAVVAIRVNKIIHS